MLPMLLMLDGIKAGVTDSSYLLVAQRSDRLDATFPARILVLPGSTLLHSGYHA